MTHFLIHALLLFAIVTIVSALVFRSRRAMELLRFLRTIAWGYALAIIVLAAWHVWRDGGL